MLDDALYIGAAGTNFSAPSGSASSSTDIPNCADGNPPKYIRVSVASGAIYFKMHPTSATATTADPLIAVSDSQIFAVSGNRKFSAYGIGAIITGVVTPLENLR